MPRLDQAEEFLTEEEPLVLPVGGHDYEVAPIDAARWVRLMALDAIGLAQRTSTAPNESDVVLVGELGQMDVLRVPLGDVADRMLDDGQPMRVVIAASRAAAAWHRWGLEAAHASWRKHLGKATPPVGGPPPAPAPLSPSTSSPPTA